MNQICGISGAGSNSLANLLQRALRDVNVAYCHAVFDREGRYRDLGLTLLGLVPASLMF